MFLDAFSKARKTRITFVMSVRLFACTSAAPTRRISLKFAIGDFYENLWINSRCGYNRAKISDTLLEYRSTFCCCWRHSVAIEALFFSGIVSTCYNSRGYTNFTRTHLLLRCTYISYFAVAQTVCSVTSLPNTVGSSRL